MTHAAGESSPGRLPPGTNAVVLAASEDQLAELHEELARAGVPHVTVVESDPPYVGRLMAIGVEPRPRGEVRRHLSSYPLLRERKEVVQEVD